MNGKRTDVCSSNGTDCCSSKYLLHIAKPLSLRERRWCQPTAAAQKYDKQLYLPFNSRMSQKALLSLPCSGTVIHLDNTKGQALLCRSNTQVNRLQTSIELFHSELKDRRYLAGAGIKRAAGGISRGKPVCSQHTATCSTQWIVTHKLNDV